jgi:hypothetical protein
LSKIDGTNFNTQWINNYTNAQTDTLLNAKANLSGATFTGTIVGSPNTTASLLGSNDTGSFSVRSNNVNSAAMSFHRTGAYAINMGLDTDNAFKIGGWSAGSSRFQIASNGAITMPAHPVFQAFGATNGASGINWVFNQVYVNVGGYYSTSTGRFTAPVAGTYLFWWTNIGNTVVTTYRYRIRRNNVDYDDLQLRLPGTGNYAPNGVQQVAMPLAANDFVNIFFASDDGSSSLTQSQYPTFGGYLLG